MRALALGARFLAATFQVPDDVILRYTPMVAPTPRSVKDYLRRAAVDRILELHWTPTQGFSSDPRSWTTDEQPESFPNPSTYGEITTTGARQLFDHMELYGWSEAAATFMDLGSGTGKLVTQGALELQCLELAIGVELDPHRHSIGSANLKSLRSWRGEDVGAAAVVHLYCGDIFHADVSGATHIYISSLCFTKEMMFDLRTKLENEAFNLQWVATLQPFPESENPSCTFALTKIEYVEMSWTKPFGCPVLFYRLQSSDQRQP